jgi:hypothetical protein
MLRYLPDPLKVLWLMAIALFKGQSAADLAVRRIGAAFPADMDHGYEPKPLPGWIPLRDQDADRYMPPTEAELAIERAAATGDWQRIAERFAATWANWDERSRLTWVAAGAAMKDDSWLEAWEAAKPGDPEALLIRAQRTVMYAWELRSAKVARALTKQQIQGFVDNIELAEERMQQAIEAAPDDPTAYECMVLIARGRSWPHERMEALWSEYTARKPHGFDGHQQALQYWCAKWRGSHDLARDFAARAAENAPEDSFLHALPLFAAFEEHGADAVEPYRSAEVQAAVNACLAALADHADTAPPHVVAQVRHVVAFTLNRTGRHAEAVEQFKAVDGYVKSLPWNYSFSPVQEYGWFRRDSVRRAR